MWRAVEWCLLSANNCDCNRCHVFTIFECTNRGKKLLNERISIVYSATCVSPRNVIFNICFDADTYGFSFHCIETSWKPIYSSFDNVERERERDESDFSDEIQLEIKYIQSVRIPYPYSINNKFTFMMLYATNAYIRNLRAYKMANVNVLNSICIFTCTRHPFLSCSHIRDSLGFFSLSFSSICVRLMFFSRVLRKINKSIPLSTTFLIFDCIRCTLCSGYSIRCALCTVHATQSDANAVEVDYHLYMFAVHPLWVRRTLGLLVWIDCFVQ